MGGVAIKLTFLQNHKFHVFVICFSVGWLMNPSKSDFGAPKKWALDGKNGLQKLPGESKNMGIAEKNGSIPEPVRLGPRWWALVVGVKSEHEACAPWR